MDAERDLKETVKPVAATRKKRHFLGKQGTVAVSVADRVSKLKKRGLGSIRVKAAKTVSELQIGRIYADSDVSQGELC